MQIQKCDEVVAFARSRQIGEQAGWTKFAEKVDGL